MIKNDVSFCFTSVKIAIVIPELKKQKRTKTILRTYTKCCLGLILVKRHFN